MPELIAILVWILIFAVVAFGLLWVCGKFFPEFPPARWICGVVLLIILLAAISGQLGNFSFPHLR